MTRSYYIKCFLIFLCISPLFCLNSVGAILCQTNIGNLLEAQNNVSDFTLFDKIWGYFVSILGPGVALLGILLARPLVKKKLIENHITQRIEQIHNSNSQVRSYCQKLISQYNPLIYNVQRLKHQDIINLSKAIEEGYLISQDSSTEAATLMYYLKNIIQQFERRFVFYDKRFATYTDDLLVFVLNNLQRIVIYTTQTVPVPEKVKVKSVDLIIKPLKMYVTQRKISKFKNFKIGVNYDVDSASCLIFTDMVNKTNNPYLMECAAMVFNTNKSIAKLLFLRKIYAPLIWENNSKDIEILKRTLHLIGFEENSTTNIESGAKVESVELYYTNLKNIKHKEILTEQSFINDFKDIWLEGCNYAFPKPLKFINATDDMIKVEFEKKNLQEAYITNKREIRKNLKVDNKASIFKNLRGIIIRS